MGPNRTREEAIERLDLVQYEHGAVSRERMRAILDLERFGGWEQEGARDLPHYLCMSLGISEWKARRLLACARALEHLPRISEAVECGALSEDKALDLIRFATPETERDLVKWANRVSGSWIRKKADMMERQRLDETQQAEKERSIDWYYAGNRFHLELDVPKSDGPAIVKQVQQTADGIPVMPDEEGRGNARLADAAVALLTSQVQGSSTDATVLITARLDDPISGDGACSMEGEAIPPPETARRYACHSRFQLLLQDDKGEPLKLGRLRRDPSASMRRVLQMRDGGCVFPGCSTTRYIEPHHIEWWGRGGHTDVDTLALLCSFHHKLPHELGWTMVRTEHGGEATFYRPDGTRYRAGPAPPALEAEEPIDLDFVGYADTG